MHFVQSYEWHFFHRFHRLTTLIIRHPSVFYSVLKKTSFSANPSHRSLIFLLRDLLYGFPVQFTDTFEHIRFCFLVRFPLFSFWFRAVD